MLDIILKVGFVLVALTMIVMILMQQGAGASAGGGFGGGGASSTVFGSRGSSNFLSKSTRNLAILFFGLSLFMAWKVSHENKAPDAGGVISAQEAAQKAPVSEVPQAPSLLPKPGSETPALSVPAAPVAAPAATPAQAPVATPEVQNTEKEGTKPVDQGSK